MVTHQGATSTNHATQSPVFFISYSAADERWATWIAWELETAGYSTMLQAWDFVPGTNFIDFMDRGLSQATVVIAVLSPNYFSSRYARWEWQAALSTGANRLVTVRIKDCPLEGLLSMITYVDLVGMTDPKAATTRLLEGMRQVLSGRAKPAQGPSYPSERAAKPPYEDEAGALAPSSERTSRRTPGAAPLFPPAAPAQPTARSVLTVLHLPGPRFGRGLGPPGVPTTPEERQSRIYADLTRLTSAGAPTPDLLVVTGDLTETGSVREFAAATEFLTGLRVLLGLEPHRLIIVPGGRDITRSACRAYFATCEADDIPPKPPFWPKWRHFTRLFQDLYQGLDDLVFDSQQPWTLFAIPDLQVVIAGLNSTINDSHRDDDHYGWIGEPQAAWFAQRLQPFEHKEWLRIGVLRHAPLPGGSLNTTRDIGLLRDTGSFDRLLSRRLNLLFHGPVDTGGSSGGSELPLIAPAGPGRWQLVQVTAEGLSRIPCLPADAPAPTPADTGGEVQKVRHQWHAAGETFAPAHATDPSAAISTSDAAPVAGAPGAEPSPTWLLLDRITEVCRARYDNPKIRPVAGAAPYLLVSYRENDVIRQQRVAAHVGELTAADIERFLGQVHAADPDTPSELVCQGPPIPQALRDQAWRHGVRVRSFLEFQGLLDLRGFVAGQTAWLRADARYSPAMYVPQRFRQLTGTNRTVRRDLVEELLALLGADDGRFILLMGDSGRGKTFALHEVARRIPTELSHLIPILLELRSLEKAHSVEAMVAAHLANHGAELIDLKAFHYMLRQGRIVLLFDGFDELVTRMTYDRAVDHLDMILAAAQGKAKIIISSRSQHFRTDAQILTALGERVELVAQQRVLSIEDFSAEDIQLYLGNRYGVDSDAAARRLRLLRDTQGLLGLSQNPRMLSFIADLDDNRLRAVAECGHAISAAVLYEKILGAWLSYEQQRTGEVHGSAGGLTLSELWQAVTALAVRLWESNEQYLELADLAEVAETLSALSEAQLTPHQALHAVGAGSLLVRTEDGQLGMIHGSVVEWLVAKAIADQLASGEPGLLSGRLLSRRPLSQLSVDFLCDLADTRSCQLWLRGVLADRDADEVTRRNAIKISTRLRSMVNADLRGAVLRGEDLSYRDLSDADLTGADLTDARLVGADLSRAVLRDAVLIGARLDEAKLVGTDLTRADLRRARLPRADLRDAVVTDSRWRGAALIDVSARAELFAATELHGAVIAPGQPVHAQFAPAAIGVSFGFEVGGIPAPIAYSRDGQTLAIGSDDGEVLLCDSASGLPLRTLRGHHGRAYAVAYSPDDAVLATAGSDCVINLWDPATGERLHHLEGCQGWVWPMGFNTPPSDAAASLLATGDSSGTVRLWDTTTGDLFQELPGHASHVWTVGFQPGGSLLATGDSAGVVRLWDTTTGALRAEFPDHRGSVYRLVFSPDSALLATADYGGTVRLYDVASRQIQQELLGHSAPVYALDFHPDGSLLASGDTHGGVQLWNVPSGRGTRLPIDHRGAIYWVQFSPGGDLLAIGGNDGIVRLWDTAAARPRHELIAHKASVWPLAFRPDGHQLATTSNDGTARLWDPASGQCTHLLRGHGRRVTSVAFNTAGTLLATSGNDGAVRLWNPRTGRLQRTLTGLGGQLVGAFFNPTSALITTPSNDGDVHLWNAESGAYHRALDVDTDYVWAATFSPDGDIVATANDDDSVQLWYGSTSRHVRTLGEHHGRVRSIAFNPAGELLATGCDDAAVRLWDVGTGVCHATLRQHTDRVYAVMFSPDGARLVSASHDGTTCIWDAHTNELLRTLAGHTGRIWSAAIDPAGAVIATAGDDLGVRLWDAGTGEHRHTLHAHTRRVWSVAFSPDGSQLASAGDDGTVRIWDLASEAAPQVRMTLLGPPEGWAALAPDGRYKLEGTVTGEFWHVIGTCRFEPGDMDRYLPTIRQLPLDATF